VGLRSVARLRPDQCELPHVIANLQSPLLPAYARAPVTFVAGEGCELIDDGGRRYLDFIAGVAVCALGHAHPAITAAVGAQAARLVHASNLYHHEPSGELARELISRSGMRGVFFCNSGAEANEAAFKLARKRAFRNGDPRRTTILACGGSFHGRTLGALAATSNPQYREGFGPLPADFEFVEFNDVAALEARMDATVAAVIVEPVQGESGVHVASDGFLRAARRLCDEHDALLIFDEVQCGAGRVGTLFAFESFGIVPDVVTLAKALANGVPIGALLAGARAAGGFEPGDHGSTFGGSPLAAAAALAHLRVRDATNLDAHVARRSSQLFASLRALVSRRRAIFAPPRGKGLLVGIPVLEPYRAGDLVDRARECGLLLGTAGGNTIRFAPPLIVSANEIERAIAILDGISSALAQTVMPLRGLP
jgi:acetylornithine/N-succinyldiaminopimelate aminotransferase